MSRFIADYHRLIYDDSCYDYQRHLNRLHFISRDAKEKAKRRKVVQKEKLFYCTMRNALQLFFRRNLASSIGAGAMLINRRT